MGRAEVPQARRGGSFGKAALNEVFRLGHEAAFLCATAEKRVMYQNQGWRLLEEKVGEDLLDVFEFSKH